MKRYTNGSEVVEAMQMTQDNKQSIFNNIRLHRKIPIWDKNDQPAIQFYTINGDATLHLGDYIVRHSDGTYSAQMAEAFWRNFSLVDPTIITA